VVALQREISGRGDLQRRSPPRPQRQVEQVREAEVIVARIDESPQLL
jgi:hypothetical protein